MTPSPPVPFPQWCLPEVSHQVFKAFTYTVKCFGNDTCMTKFSSNKNKTTADYW
jgi:hypothetical protein